MDSVKPKARTENLVFDRFDTETIVYDSTNHRAHALNRVAGTVWRCCDGNSTVEEIAGKLRQECGPAASLIVVRAALRELRNARLLEDVPPLPARLPSRRDLSARAALLVPVVASLLVPSSAAAKSHKIKDPHPKPPKPRH